MKKKSKKLQLNSETLRELTITGGIAVTQGPSRCQIYTCTCPPTVRVTCPPCE